VTDAPARRSGSRSAARRVGYAVALALTSWAAGLCFAAFGPADRAGAVASALVALASSAAALTALYISREGLARTDLQLANARLAIVLSRYPVLVPLHQSVVFPETSGLVAHHPPSVERFRLTGAAAGTYAFIQDTNDRYLLPVENAGEGPALEITGRLWSADGRHADLQGASMIGKGRTAVYRGLLAPAGARQLPVPERLAECRAEPGAPPGFLLELTCTDVFGNAFTASAVFDPAGVGAWRALRVSGPAISADIPTEPT
jgi:hypothetical protein